MTTKLTVFLLVLSVTTPTRAASTGAGAGPGAVSEEEEPPSIDVACSNELTESSVYCYMYIRDLRTWASAELNCQTYGMNLASVHSTAEQQEIEDMIQKVTNSYPETWIGGSDGEQEGIWFWSDGSPFDFNYFDPGQPDNSPYAHCMVMNYGGHKRWDDQPCSFVKPSICAKKL